MTNREILNSPRQVLTGLDRQRQFLLRTDGTPSPCPACEKPVNLFDAAGIDIDAYDFGKTPLQYRCPSCGAELEQIIPFAAFGHAWFWKLRTSWLQDQLRKAKAFDQQDSKPT